MAFLLLVKSSIKKSFKQGLVMSLTNDSVQC